MSGPRGIWDSILKSSSHKVKKLPDATMIVCGMEKVGKTSLLDTFCPNIEEDEEEEELPSKKFKILKPIAFKYFNVTSDFEDSDESKIVMTDDADAMARVNIWTIDQHVMSRSLKMISDIAASTAAQEKYLFAIVLDLNDAPQECIKNLRAWIRRLEKEAAELNVASDNDIYIRSVKILKGAVRGSDPIEPVPLAPFQRLFKAPLVVIGHKSDVIRSDDAVAAKAAKELQGKLRAICLEVGAALIYTSSLEVENLINCGTLQRYCSHRLYPESIPMTLSIQVFLPSKVSKLKYPGWTV